MVPITELWLKQKSGQKTSAIATELSVVTHTPIIVVLYIVGALTEFDTELSDRIDTLKLFYNTDVSSPQEFIEYVRFIKS